MDGKCPPFVTVIVPVWNGSDHIDRCLDALQSQTYPTDRYELLVVDNGSTDDTVERLGSRSRIRLLHEPVASSYRARNRGLAAARGEHILFTDADCVPTNDWIAHAVAALESDRDAGIVGGRITLFSAEMAPHPMMRLYEETFAFNQEEAVRSGYSVTANWISPAKLLNEVGGFNASMKSGGDAEMSRRVRALGRKIQYAPDMVVAHPIRGSFAEIRNKHLRTIGGRWSLHKGPLRVLLLIAGQARNFFRRSIIVWRRHDLTKGERIGLNAVLGYLLLLGWIEIFRLAAGGETRRA